MKRIIFIYVSMLFITVQTRYYIFYEYMYIMCYIFYLMNSTFALAKNSRLTKFKRVKYIFKYTFWKTLEITILFYYLFESTLYSNFLFDLKMVKSLLLIMYFKTDSKKLVTFYSVIFCLRIRMQRYRSKISYALHRFNKLVLYKENYCSKFCRWGHIFLSFF